MISTDEKKELDTIKAAFQLTNRFSNLKVESIPKDPTDTFTFKLGNNIFSGINSYTVTTLNDYVLDKPNWREYFSENCYIANNPNEHLVALCYKALGYKVYIAPCYSLPDKQGIDIVIEDTNDIVPIQVKGKAAIITDEQRFKYKLLNLQIVKIRFSNFLSTDKIINLPITKFISDIFQCIPTNANLWHKIDLPIYRYQIKESRAFKYQLDIINILKSKGVYAVPTRGKEIAYYNFRDRRWNTVEVNSRSNQNLITADILSRMFDKPESKAKKIPEEIKV
jgi:hypothetical protein